MKILVFDIGGKSIKYKIYKNSKELFNQKNVKIKEANKEKVFEILKYIYNENKDIDGIAISSPGAILSNGYLIGITAIKGFDNFNLVNTVKEKLNFSGKVIAINDGNAAAYADYSTVEKNKSIVTLVVGTGIGSGIIINGQMIFGKDGFGGEVGMMTTFHNENDSNFNPVPGSTSSGFYHMEKYYEKLTGKTLEGKNIFKLYDAKDKYATKSIDRMFKGLAILIFNIAVTINPDYVFIGGGLSKRKSIVFELEKYVDKLIKNLNLKLKLVEIKRSTKLGNSQLEGAYQYFIANLK